VHFLGGLNPWIGGHRRTLANAPAHCAAYLMILGRKNSKDYFSLKPRKYW